MAGGDFSSFVRPFFFFFRACFFFLGGTLGLTRACAWGGVTPALRARVVLVPGEMGALFVRFYLGEPASVFPSQTLTFSGRSKPTG